VVGPGSCYRRGPRAAVTVKEDNVIHFRLTRAPRRYTELPPADDPDLPAPSPRQKPTPDAGLVRGPETPEPTPSTPSENLTERS